MMTSIGKRAGEWLTGRWKTELPSGIRDRAPSPTFPHCRHNYTRIMCGEKCICVYMCGNMQPPHPQPTQLNSCTCTHTYDYLHTRIHTYPYAYYRLIHTYPYTYYRLIHTYPVTIILLLESPVGQWLCPFFYPILRACTPIQCVTMKRSINPNFIKKTFWTRSFWNNLGMVGN